MKFSIIIPCYNEAENIENLLKRIVGIQEEYELEYVLVENGSLDNSREVFKKNVEGKYHNIQVVYVDKNKGYGYGIQQGIKAATGEYIGWIHADLQMAPEELRQFFYYILHEEDNKNVFMKGIRTNRSSFDVFFTMGQSIFNTLLLRTKLYDVGAIPVLFERSLIDKISIDDMPNDFSLELYIYWQAKVNGFKEKRYKVKLESRENGSSSWNHGFKSKIKQSKRIFDDSIKIWKGEKVL